MVSFFILQPQFADFHGPGGASSVCQKINRRRISPPEAAVRALSRESSGGGTGTFEARCTFAHNYVSIQVDKSISMHSLKREK
jgi:hypothetical protein